jgi:hypothetical protein
MDLRFWIPIIIAALFLIWALTRHRLRLLAGLMMEHGLRTTFHLEKCHKIFKKLYEGINAMAISLKQRNELKIREDSTYTYGEVTFYSFANILETAKPKPGEIFYDLGSGGGKAVFIAGLIYDFSKCCGVEKLPDLYQLCEGLLYKLQTMPELPQYLPFKKITIQFVNEDLLAYDFTDGDIIFINATCFRGEMWDLIVAKLSKLKSGARVILGSKKLESGGFKLIHANFHLMSWGMNSVFIYEKL